MSPLSKLTGMLTLLAVLVAGAQAADVPASRADEIEQAQAEVNALHERYAEQHPKMQVAKLRLAVWQRLDKEHRPEPLILQRAWVELDLNRLKYLEKHPEFAVQRARVTAMEKQWRDDPASPDILLAAVGEQAAMATHYGENNPRYLDESRKVDAYRRYLLGAGNESYELRLARATQQYYSGRYDANHPKMQEIAAQIATLEKRR